MSTQNARVCSSFHFFFISPPAGGAQKKRARRTGRVKSNKEPSSLNHLLLGGHHHGRSLGLGSGLLLLLLAGHQGGGRKGENSDGLHNYLTSFDFEGPRQPRIGWGAERNIPPLRGNASLKSKKIQKNCRFARKGPAGRRGNPRRAAVQRSSSRSAGRKPSAEKILLWVALNTRSGTSLPKLSLSFWVRGACTTSSQSARKMVTGHATCGA